MKLFSNPEIRKVLLWLLLVSVVFCSLAFIFFGVYGFIIMLLAFVSSFVIYFYFTAERYKQLRQMSDSIDRVLHGEDFGLICDYSEGELSVLQSEIRKMTARLREAADSLKKDKIYLTDSIADISHQLRTPLTSINIMVSMLREQELSYDKRTELVYSLKSMLSRIDWLIETLLKMSKIDAGTAFFEKKQVSVRELIKKASMPLEASLDVRSQELITEIGDEFFCGDIAWSAEAVSNILKNCMEHNPPGGKIYVAARRTSVFTEITIRDTGVGLDPDDIPRLFERFYKGKTSTETSVGIGLALARSIIAQQNGTIKASNHPDGGAQFTIRYYFGII